VRLKGGEGKLSEGEGAAAIGLGSRPLCLKVCQPVADTVDVLSIRVRLHVVEVSIPTSLSPDGQEVVDEEEEWSSLHAQPLSLEDALLVARNSSNGGLTVGVNVQHEPQREHGQSPSNGLELCWVHPSSASDTGADESGSDGLSRGEQLLIGGDGTEIVVQSAVTSDD